MAPIPECDMPKREAKTVPRAGDPEDFIAALSEPAQQADCRAILDAQAARYLSQTYHNREAA